MTFATDEQSVQDAQPVELYRFTGVTTRFFTSDAEDFTNSEATWEATTIGRGKLEAGTQQDPENLDIEMASDNPLVAEYVIGVAPPNLNLTLLRVHPANPDDTLTLWDGPVTSWTLRMTRSGRVARARVPALFSFIFNRPVPRIKYQNPCNRVLGDSVCRVDLTDPAFSQAVTVSTVVNNVITINEVSQFADGDLLGGRIFVAGEGRMITANVGSVITVATPFSTALPASTAMTIRRACDHQRNGDCVNVFNNAANNLSFDLTPPRNPFNSRL